MPMPKPVPTASAEISDREAHEMALFLVRVFGDEASEVAAERALKSDQKADWQRVGSEVGKLLLDDGVEAGRKPLRRLG